MTDFGIALLLLVALSFVPSSFLPYLVGERMREEKQVQFVSGVSKFCYWMATSLWDTTVRKFDFQMIIFFINLYVKN